MMILINPVFKAHMIALDLIHAFVSFVDMLLDLSAKFVYLIHWITDKKSKASDEISSDHTNNRCINRSRGQ